MFELLIALHLYSFEAYRTQLLINYANLSARVHNIDEEQFRMLISCESRWRENSQGDYRIETNEYMANGLLQWWRSSFNTYSKKFNFKGKYEDSFAQIDLAVLVIAYDKKGINNWYNCYKFIERNS